MAKRERKEREAYCYGNPTTPNWRVAWMIFLIRYAILALLIAAPATGRPGLVWGALPLWLFVWLLVYLRRRFFTANLSKLFCLGPELENRQVEREAWPGVTLIAAGRNEAADIERAARSFAAIDYPDLEIIAVNDHSTDQTGEILERLHEELPQLRVIHDPPVQEGWLGKANAVWHAVHQANPENEWLLLTDADVVMHPNALRWAVHHAEESKFDFVTCVPFLDNGTLAEELTLSVGWGAMIIESNMDKFNRKKIPAIGVGAFILVRRQAYLESGGHSVHPDLQPEDAILAETVKKWGGRMGIMWSASMVRVRLYAGFRNMMNAAVRKNRVTVNNSALTAFSKTPLWVIPYLLPLPAAAACVYHQMMQGWSLGLSVYAIAGVAMYVEYVRIFTAHRKLCRMRAIAPWLHPAFAFTRTWIDWGAAFSILMRRPMSWRGRAFEHRASNP